MDSPLTDAEKAIAKEVYLDCIHYDSGTAKLLQKVHTEYKAMRMSPHDVRQILRSLKTRHTKLAEYDAGFSSVTCEHIDEATVQALCINLQRI